MREPPDHSHEIDIQLFLNICNRTEFERATYAHSGIADEDIQPSFS